MLMFRRLWAVLPDVAVYVYVDSSPQLRGEELFATSFELFDYDGRVQFQRRLMPLIALARDFLGQVGKGLALLWQVWLMVGPDPHQVLRFVQSIRAIVTDMGTERLLAGLPDLLPDFFRLILGRVDVILPDRAKLFPFSLSSPGWQHGWDTVLRRALSGLSFFPHWLDGMRALVSFFTASS